MFRLTLSYVKERTAFGQATGKLQIGRTFIDDLIVKHMGGKDIHSEVSMAEWWISVNVSKMAPECKQLHGGYGSMEKHGTSRLYQDIAVALIYAESNEIMKWKTIRRRII